MYIKLIITILNKLDRKHKVKHKGVNCQNPFQKSGDNHFSAMWFHDNGGIKLYNGAINGRTYFHIHEACAMLNCTNEYIKFICEHHGITEDELHNYIDEYNLHDIQFEFDKLESVELFTGQIKKDTTEYFLEEIEMEDFEYEKCMSYLQERKVEPIKGVFEPCKILEGGISSDGTIAWEREKLCIVSRHSCGFNKYRFLNKTGRRFTATPNSAPKDFMWVRNTDNGTLYICEGNVDGVTMSQYISDDIAVMGSTTSLPSNLKQLQQYDKVVILVDQDSYDKSIEYLESTLKKANVKNFHVRKKTEIYYNGEFTERLKMYDYNFIHVHNALDRQTIETGFLHEKVFNGKEGFENNMSWQQFLLDNN